jgi:hypothetical protein
MLTPRGKLIPLLISRFSILNMDNSIAFITVGKTINVVLGTIGFEKMFCIIRNIKIGKNNPNIQ